MVPLPTRRALAIFAHRCSGPVQFQDAVTVEHGSASAKLATAKLRVLDPGQYALHVPKFRNRHPPSIS